MSDYPYHHNLRLENFTVFRDSTFDFVPGVNVFVGENGTGKTHVLKALYAWQLAQSRQDFADTEEGFSVRRILSETFQTPEPHHLTRLPLDKDKVAKLSGHYGSYIWEFLLNPNAAEHPSTKFTKKVLRPVFIPAIDMMGHTRGFLQAASEVVLDFDRTCRDIVSLLGLQHKNGAVDSSPVKSLEPLLGGTLEYDENSSRFYLATEEGRIPMPLVAEGIRKIATLVRLAQNGWLVPGTTLFWDEPEVNLNPKWMDEVVAALLALAQNGIQVFLATHSYVILKELDLQTQPSIPLRYFGFEKTREGTLVHATDELALLQPNPILEQYNSLYDRELTRATERERKRK